MLWLSDTVLLTLQSVGQASSNVESTGSEVQMRSGILMVMRSCALGASGCMAALTGTRVSSYILHVAQTSVHQLSLGCSWMQSLYLDGQVVVEETLEKRTMRLRRR